MNKPNYDINPVIIYNKDEHILSGQMLIGVVEGNDLMDKNFIKAIMELSLLIEKSAKENGGTLGWWSYRFNSNWWIGEMKLYNFSLLAEYK